MVVRNVCGDLQICFKQIFIIDFLYSGKVELVGISFVLKCLVIRFEQ
jgi:hypothetical protein